MEITIINMSKSLLVVDLLEFTKKTFIENFTLYAKVFNFRSVVEQLTDQNIRKELLMLCSNPCDANVVVK